MGVKQSGSERLEQSLSPERLMREVAQTMDNVLTEGKDLMVGYIETRGTGRVWSRPWGENGRSASIPGRDDTGQMKGDVEGRVTEADSNHVRGMLGWKNGSPTYYQMQEDGFFHVLTQDNVEGMHALRDASEETTVELIDQLNDLVRRTLA